jgi:vancomycin resistance protein YoaR
MNRSAKVALLGFLALSSVGGASAFASARLGLANDVVPGTRVAGRVIDPVAPGDWLDARRRTLGQRTVAVTTHDGFAHVALADLGVELDVAETQRRVLAASHGSIVERAQRWSVAREGGIDVTPAFRLDRAKAETFFAALAPALRREPVSARLDLEKHLRIDDVPGVELDVEATIERLAQLPHEDGDVLEPVLRHVRPAVTSADIAHVDVSKVLSANETTFVLWGTGQGRAVNITTAARKLDGLLLGPGEAFSFNDVVGPRTLEAGFTHAPEIHGDELEMGVGGGTCQVASTLHGAAVFGALDIVDRQSHGRPSAYTKMGLDATVAYGKVDLKVRNPFPFPVIVHAYLPKPTAIRVEILGADPQAKVEYRYGINKSDDFFRRITLKPGLPSGKVVLHQKGIKGFAVVSYVTVTYPDGRAVERAYTSDYRPVPEVFWVGPGVDETTLPELPEGVQRIERRGVPAPPPAADAQGG